MCAEEWRLIAGFEGRYEVSNFGNVRSATRHKKGELLAHCVDKDGYLFVRPVDSGLPKNRRVHRLVAQAFLANPSNKREVNHKDGDKRNNFVDNLEWSTRKENASHAAESGLYLRGARHSNAKINESDVREMRARRAAGALLSDLAKKYGIDKSNVGLICAGKSWRHVT